MLMCAFCRWEGSVLHLVPVTIPISPSHCTPGSRDNYWTSLKHVLIFLSILTILNFLCVSSGKYINIKETEK